jgi:polysaccharide biosynthesis/export protein
MEHSISLRRRAPSLAPGAALIATGLALAACSTTVPLPPVPEARIEAQDVPKDIAPYRLQVGDELTLRFLVNPELNEEVAVRPDGKISTTIVEEVQAEGRTVPELTADLRTRYGKELTNPRLNVVVKSFAPTRVYVAGEVTTPGEYLTSNGPPPTLAQAIARAGGIKTTASTARVFLVRRGPDGRPTAYTTHYDDIITGRDPSADVRLAPYDVVYVPRSGIAQTAIYWNEFVQQFVPVSWGFSYVLNQSMGGSTVIPSPASH